ncbi:LAETG motif-containing sortase-dependent surface protein [Kitasatospora sp. NPDC059463]|uniref:LAETG motif-containing sortase-dependent surface protein n=1 Tax=unclassified Kitasatospora TaxID=2633591 RepID=UPI00367EA1C3
MRTSRLLAASTLLALTLGATAGTAVAGAVAVSPTPTATGTATGTPGPTATATATATPSTTGTPSASASPSASPSATATPSATPTHRPTVPPTLLPTTAPGLACSGGVSQGEEWLKVTGTGLWNTTLAPGATQETSVTWENLSGVELTKFHTYLYLTLFDREDGVDSHAWDKDFFTVQFHAPGQDWKSVELNDWYLDTGTFRLGKGEKLTLRFRITPTAKAPLAMYSGNFGGGDTAMDNALLPHPAKPDPKGCTQYINLYEGEFKLTGAGAASTASAAAKPSAPASAKPAGTASPSAASGPHLAETGSDSSTLPIAVAGAAVLAAGAGTLLVLRRRKAGAHN